MKVGLVGGSNQQTSLIFDSQRTINLYPVLDQEGKEVSALYGTPGIEEFGVAGDGPIRGAFTAANGRSFFVSGGTLYEVDLSGNETFRGALTSYTESVTMEENGLQLAICDGSEVYIFTFATNAFAVVSDVDLPAAGTLTFIDGYFVIDEVDSGRFYISALYDGTSWDALDFATAESSPDSLVRVFEAVGQLWLLGIKTSEVWTNTGDSSFPFERISGAKLSVGCVAPYSVLSLDDTLFWLGRTDKGTGVVYRANGFSPQRISTESIEKKLQAASNPENIRGYAYEQDGHTFYVLTDGGLETSLVYDLNTELWHERARLNDQGFFEPHLGSCHTFNFGYHILGSRLNGQLYRLSTDLFSDDGDALARERIYTHVFDEGKPFRVKRLEIGFEVGVGLQTGQGSNPMVSMWYSKNGGRTWSTGRTAEIGRVGEYSNRVVFRGLGTMEQLTIRIRVTDPVKVAICGSYIF